MKSGIKKTMRVATTFTGAAACAVGFNNPAAMAGTARPAAQAGQQQLHRIALAENRRVSGSIREANCASHSHWMHMGGPQGSVGCIGFKGLLGMSPYPNLRSLLRRE